MIESSELVAWGAAEFHRGNIAHIATMSHDERVAADRRFRSIHPGVAKMTDFYAMPREVIDMTPVYEEVRTTGYQLYEDTVAMPPFQSALACYVNRHGNVHLLDSYCVGRDDGEGFDAWTLDNRWQPSGDREGEPLDWDSVHHVIVGLLYCADKRLPWVRGPMLTYRIAADEIGTPLDINWLLHEPDLTADDWLPCATVYLRTITWLACRNVELVVPHRPRPLARRIARYGCDVKEMWVRPVGKTYQHEAASMRRVGGEGMPLSTVRGHIARYGVEGRKLLFGKIAGTFWIPGAHTWLSRAR